MDDKALTTPLWWEDSGEEDRFRAVQADYETLRDCSARQDRFATYERIYRNEDILNSDLLTAEIAARGGKQQGYSRASYNLIATATDNIVSRIIRNKPRAIYQVSGSNWSLRRTARNQQKWVDYVAHSEFFPRAARTQVRDGVLLGIGHTKVAKKPGVNEIGVWYVHPSDVFVDAYETAYGEPRRMFQRQFCSRDAALRMFPGKEELIEKSSVMSEEDFRERKMETAGMPIQAMTEIVEAWHLPTFEGAGDGQRILFCSEGILGVEDWKRPDFPILSFQWKSRPGDHFQGIAVPDEILGIHLDLNFSLQVTYEIAEGGPGQMVFTPKGANVSKSEISNAATQVIEYSGQTPPTVVLPPKVQMDLLQLTQDQEARAYRRLGLDSPTPNEPSAGLETGRAVRMDFDARSMAFALALQNYENLYKDFGDKCVAAGKQIWEKDKNFSVVVPRNKYTVEDVNWEDVSLDPRKDSYTVKVTAGSSLSQHPAGRIDDVMNMVNMGAVTEQTEMRSLLSMEDLEHSNSMATASREAVEWMCEEMMDDGVPHTPEPYDDLDLCLSIANAHYLRARSQKAPEDRLDLLRAFLDETNLLISKRDVQRAAQEQQMLQSATPPAPDATGQNPSAIGDINE